MDSETSKRPSSRPLTLRGQVFLSGVIVCESGLHVGGNRDAASLAAVELPVARDPATRLPIVPASSLKGKMRSLLELLRGKVRYERGQVVESGEVDAIELLFGAPSARRDCGPTRLVVRDAFPLERDGHRDGTASFWSVLETDGLGTEVKAEASLNRVTAAAKARQVERVVAGSRFALEATVSIFDHREDEASLVKDVLIALALLEDSYLGGHGSRGYGRVKILLRDAPQVVRAADYEAGRRLRTPGGELRAIGEIDVDAYVGRAREALGAPKS
jgi:CRISPR-associated protein Csm3